MCADKINGSKRKFFFSSRTLWLEFVYGRADDEKKTLDHGYNEYENR